LQRLVDASLHDGKERSIVVLLQAQSAGVGVHGLPRKSRDEAVHDLHRSAAVIPFYY
jgi:hypothetical protein